MTRIIRIGLRPSSASRPDSELYIQQTNAPDNSEYDRCAYQLCSCPTDRVKCRIPTARIKMTRNGRSHHSAFQ
eukprot:7762375-Pyramimonas_sp.AAC.1